MRYRTMFFLSAFILSVGASFAFTNAQFTGASGYYYDPVGICRLGTLEQQDCFTYGAGPACTINNVTLGHVPAYNNQAGTMSCSFPLYELFNE